MGGAQVVAKDADVLGKGLKGHGIGLGHGIGHGVGVGHGVGLGHGVVGVGHGVGLGHGVGIGHGVGLGHGVVGLGHGVGLKKGLVDGDKIAKQGAEAHAVSYHKDGESYQEYGAQEAAVVAKDADIHKIAVKKQPVQHHAW